MCGRYTLRVKLNVLLSQFAAELAGGTEWEPRYNIPPTTNVPAVRLQDGKRQLALFKWGLIPSWAKDAKIAYRAGGPGSLVLPRPAHSRRAGLMGACRLGPVTELGKSASNRQCPLTSAERRLAGLDGRRHFSCAIE